MATSDPRAIRRFDGIGHCEATFVIDDSTITFDATEVGGSAQVGLAVTLSDDETVALAGDGEAVIGKLLRVESDGEATVQVSGFCTLPLGATESATVGGRIVGDGAGAIRDVASAEAAELAVAHHTIISDAVTTAIIVKLD